MAGILPFLLLLSCACAEAPPVGRSPLAAEFVRPGVLEIHGAGDVSSVEIRDAAGLPVAVSDTFGRDLFEVRVDWRAAETYRIVPDSGAAITAAAPASKPLAALRIHAPLGQNVYEYLIDAENPAETVAPITVLADPNENVDLLVELEKLGDRPLPRAVLSLGPDRRAPSFPLMDTVLDDAPISLRFEFDKQIFQSRIHIGDTLPEGAVVVFLTGEGVDVDARLFFSKRDLSANDLAVTGWVLPCDEEGRFMPGRAPNQVALPNPVWQKLGAFFDIRTERISSFDPFVHEQLTFENRSGHPVNLLIKSAAIDPEDGSVIPYFSAPDFLGRGTVKPVMGYCQVPAKATKRCVMPVFVSPETEAGTYHRQLTLYPMGSDKVLRTLDGEVNVLRSHRLFSLWLVVIVLVSLIWLVLFIVFYQRIVSAFGVRVLTLLSLLGALKFCLGFGTEVLNRVLYGVLGPFNCLVGGFFSEVVTYLLVTSVLFLVPRVGAMTIAGIVSYLIRGILFGSFGLTDILYTGSSIAFFEICLFLFGVTRFGQVPHRRPRTVPLMLALGIADAAGTFSSLTLYSVFYRLFFADWYIVLQVGITGFLYTLIGVYLGRSLGLSLKKVHL